jgi:hypothetical protein
MARIRACRSSDMAGVTPDFAGRTLLAEPYRCCQNGTTVEHGSLFRENVTARVEL